MRKVKKVNKIIMFEGIKARYLLDDCSWSFVPPMTQSVGSGK